MQSLGEAEVPEMIPLTDLRGSAIENGGDFPGVRGTSPIHLVVQVAALEQQGSCEGDEEISSDHSVLLAASMKGQSVTIATMILHSLCCNFIELSARVSIIWKIILF